MRRACLAAAVLLLGLGVRPGLAQNNQVIRFDPGDSVLAVRVGTSASVNLIVDVGCQGVSTYDITLFYDAARVQLSGAAAIPSINVPAPTVTLFTDSARLVSSGGAGSVFCSPGPFVNLTFAMSGGATTGSLVSLRVNHMLDGLSQDVTPFIVTGLLDVCQAVHTWGDIDDNGVITSRDALVALTAAVGLPTIGFDLSPGDVDADGVLTSRDALFILSAGIGLETFTRVGRGIPNHCAPLAPTPNDLLYWTGNAGLTLNRVVAGDTTPVVLSLPQSANTTWAATFSPDGGKIAYSCNGIPTSDICTVDRNGGHLHELNVGSRACNGASQPFWSPSGTQIAFVDGNCSNTLWVTDSTGLNAHAILTGFAIQELGGWSSSGLVFTTCCSRRLWVVSSTGTGVHEVFTNSFLESPADPAWSPAADSVTFTQTGLSNNDGSLTVVSATSLQQGVRQGQLMGLAETPSWLTAGFAFRAPVGSTHEAVLQKLFGRYLRLTRSTNPGGASRPSFR